MYCIDLTKKTPQIVKKTQYQLEIMAENKDCSIEELNGYDMKLFQSETDAEKFLEKYSRVEKTLKRIVAKSDDVKASILYKKRYMIQTILGIKNQTYRNSEQTIEQMAKVKVGELFRLYDQTNQIVVRLLKKSMSKGVAKYEFEFVR